MAARAPKRTGWPREWWLFAGVLFVHLPVDLLTTLFVVDAYGLGVEVNPIMRWLLAAGLLAVTISYLGVTILLVAMFAAVRSITVRSREPIRSVLTAGVTAWLVVLFVAGIVVVANNLLALVAGQSLF